MKSECSLFYTAPLGVDFNDLISEIKTALAETEIIARTKYVSRFDLALSLGDLSLTVAHSPVPLDLRPYADAKAPDHAPGLPVLTQRVLAGHQSAIVVRVTGPSAAGSDATRRALCYIAANCILAASAPDVIYWGASNTLYTLNAFCAQTGDARPRSAPPARQASAVRAPNWFADATPSDLSDTLLDLREGSHDGDGSLEQPRKRWPLGQVTPPGKM